jgi:MarR family transcriptional regulator, transcriptional regulator for hemolysin
MQDQANRALFGQLVTRVSRYWRRAIDQALVESDLSQATALPLLVLSRRGADARQGVIADELGLEGPSLVRIVELLVAENLVIRREDPSDRRAKLLSLTERGQIRVQEIEAAIKKVRERVLADLDEAEFAVTIRVLSKIEQSLLRVSAS